MRGNDYTTRLFEAIYIRRGRQRDSSVFERGEHESSIFANMVMGMTKRTFQAFRVTGFGMAEVKLRFAAKRVE